MAVVWLITSACGENPVGMGRPPGFGPELDQKAIALFRELQQFLTNDLGYQPDPQGGVGKVRNGVLRRVFCGAWRLENGSRQKFMNWKKRFLSTPGMTVLGIFTDGMPYLMMNMCVDYRDSALGDYSFLRWSSSAYDQLVKDCKKFSDMAQGYIDRLHVRLSFEAQISTPGTGINRKDGGSPITIMDIYGPEGRKKVDEMMKQRLKNKGIK